MATLAAQVRTKSGASVTEASDARIIEALEAASVRITGGIVTWELLPSGAYSRTGRIGLGKYLVAATLEAASATPIVMHDQGGTAIAALSCTQQGIVTTSAPSGTLPIAFATGRAYDVHAAAADIVGDRIAQASGAFDFKRGDQSFDRSQIVSGLRALQKELRRHRIPRRRGEVFMRDQAPPSC